MKRTRKFVSKEKKRVSNSEIYSSKVFQFQSSCFQKLPKDYFYEIGAEETEQSFGEFLRTSPTVLKGKSTHFYFLKVKRISGSSKERDPLNILKFQSEIEEYLNVFFDSGNSKLGKVKFIGCFVIEELKRNEFWLHIPYVDTKKPKVRVKIRTRKGLDHDYLQFCVQDLLFSVERHVAFQKVVHSKAYNLVGMIMNDLFWAPKRGESPNLFISGLACRTTNVLSLGRYDPLYLEKSMTTQYETSLNFFSKKDKKETKISKNLKSRETIVVRRVLKTLTHENLHNFGLGHCTIYSCLMNSTFNIEQDLNAPYQLCPNCLKKFMYFAEFEPVARYKRILDWFEKRNIGKEVSWYQRRLNFVQSKGKAKDVIEIEDDDSDSDVEIITQAKKKRKVSMQ